ncbi:RQC domain-containing protein [uncultured Vagococcus sp.]|uniref:RQC domain-containing protein n=1 Tax=uncultured Vagococcus sp. TaxID=189676 RepID=UPI00258CEC84|nr:RQC domain-containing protein [uncultured Vagococcus sp.]
MSIIPLDNQSLDLFGYEDLQEEAQCVLLCLAELDRSVSFDGLAAILQGRKTKYIRQAKLYQLSTYGDLISLDMYIKEHLKIKTYVSYTDDFILIHPSKTYLEECYDKIDYFLKSQLDLTFNSKTKIVLLNSGITYLGYRFYIAQHRKCVVTPKTEFKKEISTPAKRKKYHFYVGNLSYKELYTSLLSLEESYSQGETYSLMTQIYRSIIFEKISK